MTWPGGIRTSTSVRKILTPPAVAAALGKIRSTHCTVLNSPPTTSLLHWRRTQERSSSSSPSSVIRINCYKGNICTPQILLVFLVVARSFPSPIADSGEPRRRRKSNSNWETTAYKYTIMLSYALSFVQGANSFLPCTTPPVVCMNCSAFVNSHHSPLFADVLL